ncbi:hypothetical protein H0H87_002708, partial [Tephrocybe sp. NHM501043]
KMEFFRKSLAHLEKMSPWAFLGNTSGHTIWQAIPLSLRYRQGGTGLSTLNQGGRGRDVSQPDTDTLHHGEGEVYIRHM